MVARHIIARKLEANCISDIILDYNCVYMVARHIIARKLEANCTSDVIRDYNQSNVFIIKVSEPRTHSNITMVKVFDHIT